MRMNHGFYSEDVSHFRICFFFIFTSYSTKQGSSAQNEIEECQGLEDFEQVS